MLEITTFTGIIQFELKCRLITEVYILISNQIIIWNLLKV